MFGTDSVEELWDGDLQMEDLVSDSGPSPVGELVSDAGADGLVEDAFIYSSGTGGWVPTRGHAARAKKWTQQYHKRVFRARRKRHRPAYRAATRVQTSGSGSSQSCCRPVRTFGRCR